MRSCVTFAVAGEGGQESSGSSSATGRHDLNRSLSLPTACQEVFRLKKLKNGGFEKGSHTWYSQRYMVDPSTLFEGIKVQCARCGKVNDLGSRSYFADESTRCVHCGFLFIRHSLRQMAKMREMLENDPEWVALIRAGRFAEVKRRLDKLVPLEGEAV